MADSVTEVPSISSCANSRKRTRSPDSPFDELKKKKRKPNNDSLNTVASFTDRFFLDMAATIARDFPIHEFAKAHYCSSSDVVDALRAVVLSPLQEPQLWHGAESVSDYGQILIADWRSRQTEHEEGTSSSPITISDSSSCLTPVSSPRHPVSEASLVPHISGTSRFKTASPLVSYPGPPESSEGTSVNNRASEAKASVSRKADASREKPTTARTEVCIDIYGTCIPVDKWIDGYHVPALPRIRGDGLSDVEFYEMLADGWFD